MLLKTFILFGVLALVLAEIYQIPLIKVESQMVKMIRSKTWAAHLKKMAAQRKMADFFSPRDGKEIYSQEVGLN